MTDRYIQIGVTALRDPATGEFLPATPLYIKETPEAVASQDKMIEDFGRLMAGHIRQYIEAGGLPEEAAPHKASERSKQ